MATKKKAAKASGAKRKPPRSPKGLKVTHTAHPPKITIYIEDKNYYQVTVDRITKGLGDDGVIEARCFWDGTQWICE